MTTSEPSKSSRRKPAHPSTPHGDVIFVTGFPSYLAQRITRELLVERPKATLYLLNDGEGSKLSVFLRDLEVGQRSRVVPLTGQVGHMDLGLASDEYRGLVAEVTEIHHIASSYTEGGGHGDRLRKVNVQGTRELVELAGQCASLRRLVHYSTVFVSGTRQGVIMEEDLECGQRFHNTWEQTRYEAERLVRRAARKLPVTVLRLGVMVGDSETGELGPYDGPWRLLTTFLDAPREQPALLSGSGNAPVHLVPVDFVVRAAVRLAVDPRAEGSTFHLVDPSPLPANKVIELVARKAHRRPQPQAVPKILTRLLRVHPRVERLAGLPLAPPEIFDQLVFFNSQGTLALLHESGIRCPSFSSYAQRLIEYAKATRTGRQLDDDAPADPLA